LSNVVDDYYSKAQYDVGRWAENEKLAFMNEMDKKYFTKKLNNVEEKFIDGEDFIPDLFEL
jgi:hypothetical protein